MKQTHQRVLPLPLSRALFAALCVTLLTGCFEFSEEVWINDDLTGRVKVEFGVSEALIALGREMEQDPLAELRASYEETKQKLEGHPNVESVTVEEYSEGGLHRMALDVRVRDIREIDDEFTSRLTGRSLLGDAAGDSMKPPSWNLRFRPVSRRRVEFIQEIIVNADKATNPGMPRVPNPDEEPFNQFGEAMGRAMLASMFGDRYITVTLHAPHIQNTDGRLNEDQTTVEWKIPLLDLVSDELIHRELRAEITLPVRWVSWPVAGIGLAVLALIAALVWRARAGRVPPAA